MRYELTCGCASYYPVFLDLRGRRVLIVGGGGIAQRKAEGLVAAGAEVMVVAPEALPMPPEVTVHLRRFDPADTDGAFFIIAATDDRAVNTAVAQAAEAHGILVNVVDTPDECSVILPAVVRRGEFCLAISTGGASPTFARRIKERLETEFVEEYGTLVDLLRELRQTWEPQFKAANLPAKTRKDAWERVLDLPLLEWMREGEVEDARAAAEGILQAAL